jgi:hypothetical protein
VLANLLLRAAQNRIRFSIEQLTTADPRPPILFLRAFRDDQVELSNPRLTLLGRFFAIATRRQSLDHLLLQEGTLYGPVVALGNPNDKFPPYGVARGYVDHAHWQGAVSRLANDSLAVVICVDDTEAMWWEIEHLVAHEHLRKTLFLIHPKFSDPADNAKMTRRLVAKLATDAGAVAEAGKDVITKRGTIGFYFDKSGNLCIGESANFTRFSYLLMLRWFLRKEFGLEIRRLRRQRVAPKAA